MIVNSLRQRIQFIPDTNCGSRCLPNQAAGGGRAKDITTWAGMRNLLQVPVRSVLFPGVGKQLLQRSECLLPLKPKCLVIGFVTGRLP